VFEAAETKLQDLFTSASDVLLSSEMPPAAVEQMVLDLNVKRGEMDRLFDQTLVQLLHYDINLEQEKSIISLSPVSVPITTTAKGVPSVGTGGTPASSLASLEKAYSALYRADGGNVEG